MPVGGGGAGPAGVRGGEGAQLLRVLSQGRRAHRLAFPDRWSLALLSQAYVAGLGEEELGDLARRFYNDAYVMDQNACSSPQLAVWLADGGEAGARRRWWEAVAREAEGRYCLEAFQAARKIERFCRRAMAGPGVEGLERYGGNLVWTARLSGPPGENLPPRGGFGLFWEREIGTLDQLPALLDDRAQTVVCVGVDPAETAAFLAARGPGASPGWSRRGRRWRWTPFGTGGI